MQAFSGNLSPFRTPSYCVAESNFCALRKSAGGICEHSVATGLHYRAILPFVVGLHPEPPRVTLHGEGSEHSGSGICAASSTSSIRNAPSPGGQSGHRSLCSAWAVACHHLPERYQSTDSATIDSERNPHQSLLRLGGGGGEADGGISHRNAAFRKAKSVHSSSTVRSALTCDGAANITPSSRSGTPKNASIFGEPLTASQRLFHALQSRTFAEGKSACGICDASVADVLHYRAILPFVVGLHPKPPRVTLPGEGSEHSGSGICAASSTSSIRNAPSPGGQSGHRSLCSAWAVACHHLPEHYHSIDFPLAGCFSDEKTRL